jgi:hypothetical protein
VPSDYSFSGPVNKENYGMAQRPSLPKMNPGGFAEARASQASTIRWPCFSRILERLRGAFQVESATKRAP